MKMAQDLAGYSLGQADLLRRAMGKKKVAEMQKHRGKFIDGATKNGVKGHIAENLFEPNDIICRILFKLRHRNSNS